jgi:uracil-DNA glycosylase
MITWHDLIGEEKEAPYFKDILSYVNKRRELGVEVYPPSADVFNAFKYTSLDNLKVVIIGQDPYHGPNQAHGLCFSVNKGIPNPPSLRNIFQELKNEYGEKFIMPEHGCLSSWAQQGVFLLNNTLTVERGHPQSHANIGWDIFTEHVIKKINDNLDHIVFMLWGSPAQKKCKCVDENKHLILKTVHPSPLSAYRGFFGCQHFIKCNEYLEKNGKSPINWQI